MKKPDFPLRGKRIEWTKPRVAYVRHLAEDRGMTALEVADDIGLPAGNHPRIFAIARRFKIRLPGRAHEARRLVVTIDIDDRASAVLSAIAARMNKKPREVASLLVAGACDQGQTFCENILDDEG